MFAGVAQAQTDAMYSQYMFNSLLINPAQAGSMDHISATLLAREQWTGLAGRPRTQTLAVDGTTSNQRNGFGLTLLNDNVGSTRATAVNLMYAYRVKFTSETRLSLGLQATAFNMNTDFTGLRVDDPTDPTIGVNSINLWRPNVGAGAFFRTRHMFMGLSAPSILDWNISKQGNNTARRGRTFFATVGAIARISRDVQLRPSALVKYQPNLPMQADINLMAFFKEKYWLGASYRMEDAVVLMAQWQINPQWRVGYAYDINTSSIRSNTNGSHEIMLSFDLHFERNTTLDPRFFR